MEKERKAFPFLRALIWSAVIALVISGAAGFTFYRRLQPPKRGGDFTLHSSAGPVSLHDFKGKAVVIYFGYTSCPDVCPISLGKLSQTLTTFSNAERAKLQTLFVSVDHRGDTPMKAQDYAQFFMKDAIGLTGSKPEIDAVVHLYGTSYVIEDTKKSAMGYSVQHSSSFFLVDDDGDFVGTVSTDVATDVLAKELRKIL